MKKKIDDCHAGQFLYLGRWVDKNSFQSFVYDKENNEKLAKSYPEFVNLIASGLWFASKKIDFDKPRKAKDAHLSDSK